MLFRLSQIGYMPNGLRTVLESPFIPKIGAGLNQEDRRRLLQDYDVDLNGTLDVFDIAKRLGFRQFGLAYLTEKLLGTTDAWSCTLHINNYLFFLIFRSEVGKGTSNV